MLLNIGSDGWPAMNITVPLIQASDIATIDPYVDYRSDNVNWQVNDPYNGNSPRVVAKALDYLRAVVDAAGRSGGNKPAQIIAVLGTLPRVQPPTAFRPATAAEARAEAFVAINHGASGILYWQGVRHNFRTMAPGLWDGLAQTATDIQSLASMVLAPPPPPGALSRRCMCRLCIVGRLSLHGVPPA